MTADDWHRVIDECESAGVRAVQFIGGEPTLHPNLPEFVNHALACGLDVEVYTNLVHVRPKLWDLFDRPGVRLATSYYSDDSREHAAITGRRGSYERTKNNIGEALRRSIPLRVGIVDMHDGQRAEQARAELAALGVVDVGYDRIRHVGRGVSDDGASVEQLCGSCASGALAVSPDGAVWPCVFSRWLPVGNVRDESLSTILTGERLRGVRAELSRQFADRDGELSGCRPDCGPNHLCDPKCQPYTSGCHPECNPSCSPRCNPISCRPNCLPPRKG